jgi:hypothetical protein
MIPKSTLCTVPTSSLYSFEYVFDLLDILINVQLYN